jgi:hypothetical protein
MLVYGDSDELLGAVLGHSRERSAVAALSHAVWWKPGSLLSLSLSPPSKFV